MIYSTYYFFFQKLVNDIIKVRANEWLNLNMNVNELIESVSCWRKSVSSIPFPYANLNKKRNAQKFFLKKRERENFEYAEGSLHHKETKRWNNGKQRSKKKQKTHASWNE